MLHLPTGGGRGHLVQCGVQVRALVVYYVHDVGQSSYWRLSIVAMSVYTIHLYFVRDFGVMIWLFRRAETQT